MSNKNKLIAWVAVLLPALNIFAQPVTFTNTQTMTMVGAKTASLYPSEIQVNGMPPYLHEVTVRFDLTTTNGIYGLDMLLQAPDGQYLMLLSDVNLNAGGFLDDIGIGTAGEVKVSKFNLFEGKTYLPANYTNSQTQVDNFPAPGPGVFNQPDPDITSLLDINPNGTWKLFVMNDYFNAVILNVTGWKLILEAGNMPACRKAGFPELVQANDWDALVKWEPGSGNNLWDLYLTENIFNDVPGDGSVPVFNDVSANNGFLVTGLKPGHEYGLYVRPDCGNGNVGKWRGPLVFETLFQPCEYAVQVPALCDTFNDPGLPWFDGFIFPPNLPEWSFRFSPQFNGDYFIQFPDVDYHSVTWFYEGNDCPETGWTQAPILTDYGDRINKLENLEAGKNYWLLHAGPVMADGPPPFFMSPCLLPFMRITNPNPFVDSVQVNWLHEGSVPLATEFEFFYGASPLVPPDANTQPHLTGIHLPANGKMTFANLLPDTEYTIYLRTRCDANTVSCWQGPFTIKTQPYCAVIQSFTLDSITSTWAAFTLTWDTPFTPDNCMVKVCPAGDSPSGNTCTELWISNLTAETLSVFMPDINAVVPQVVWLKLNCTNTMNQPWQGPYSLPLSTAPPVPIREISCGDNNFNDFMGVFGQNTVYLPTSCFDAFNSNDEKLYRFKAGTTGTVKLFNLAIGGTPGVSRVAVFTKLANLPPDGNNWQQIGCWIHSPGNLPPLEMQVVQDSSYFILFDYSGPAFGNFTFRLINCENNCPPVASVSVQNISPATADLEWNEPLSGATYLYQLRPEYASLPTLEMAGHPATSVTLTGLDRAVRHRFQVRTECPDGTKSDWIETSFLTGDNPLFQEAVMTRCNPRFSPQGGPPFSYDVAKLEVPQDGAYFLASDFPLFYIYENGFDPVQPAANLLAEISEPGLASFPLRKDTILNLQAGVQYILVPTGKTILENYGEGAIISRLWMDGPAIAALSEATFNGKEASAHGSVVDFPFWQILEDDFICPDTGGWVHFYRHGTDLVGNGDDVLLFSMENYPALEASHAFNRLEIGDEPGASLITNPPADYVMNQSGWYVMNRFWNYPVTQAFYQPDGKIKVRLYYTDGDFLDLQNAIAQQGGMLTNHEDLFFYKINGVSDAQVLAPQNSHPGIKAASSYDDPLGYWEYVHGPEATDVTWRYGSYKNAHFAEMMIRWFSGGGGGVAINGQGALSPVSIPHELPAALRPVVFPNPFTSGLTIRLEAESGVFIEKIEIFDVMGRLVLSSRANGALIHLSTASLPPGSYLMRISTTAGNVIYKLRASD
jgi:hypothetical protein